MAREPGTNSATVYLSVRDARAQPVTSSQFLGIDLEGAGLDVDHDEIHRIAALEAIFDFLFKNDLAALDNLLFRVPAFRGCHEFSLRSPHHWVRLSHAASVTSVPSSTPAPF